MDCKILIVEDEAKLREVLCDYFLSKGERPVDWRPWSGWKRRPLTRYCWTS